MYDYSKIYLWQPTTESNSSDSPRRTEKRIGAGLDSAESDAESAQNVLCSSLEPTSPLLQVLRAIAAMDAQLNQPCLSASYPSRQSDCCLVILSGNRIHEKGVQCLETKHQKSRMPCSSDATLAYTTHGKICLHCTGAIY